MQLFTSIYYDCRLLPHFLEHYERLGVTQFVVLLNGIGQPKLMEQAIAYSAGHQVQLEGLDSEGFDVTQTYRVLDALRQRYAEPGSWIVVADLDEFVEVPTGLSTLVQRCEREGCDYVRGRLVDRLSADGRFPKMNALPLSAQFPVAADITRNLLGACVDKIPLMRASCPIEPGLHSSRGQPLQEVCLDVHHFKWFDGIVERMRDRLFMYFKYGSPYWSEPDAFLRQVAREARIDLTDPRLHARPARVIEGA